MLSNRVRFLLAVFTLVWISLMVVVYYHADTVTPSQPVSWAVDPPNDPERERELKIIADEIRKEFQEEGELLRLESMPGNDFDAR